MNLEPVTILRQAQLTLPAISSLLVDKPSYANVNAVVKRIDQDAKMGPALLKGAPDALRADIKAWQKKHAVRNLEL